MPLWFKNALYWSSSSDHEDGIQNTEPRWFWWIQQKHRATLVFHGSMNNWRLLILQENCIWNAVFQTSFPEVPRLELESKRDSSVPVVRLIQHKISGMVEKFGKFVLKNFEFILKNLNFFLIFLEFFWKYGFFLKIF